MTNKTRKSHVPWKGWNKEKPSFHEKTIMLKKCGRKCFLGSRKTFPICKKNTCKISRIGVYAAFVRAREYSTLNKKDKKYKNISKRAKKLLRSKSLSK
jgi:hypothetical protein